MAPFPGFFPVVARKNMNRILLIACLIFLSVWSLQGQNRVERPLQIQLNASGVFLKTFGNAIADEEVDDLEVNKWLLPGLSIGYHLNKRFYLGYAFQPNRQLTLREQWSFAPVPNDGNIAVYHNTGASHALEGRYFPFGIDLYASLSFIHVNQAAYQMDFDRIGNTLRLGQNDYVTDLEADWHFRSLTTLGIGLGYNYVSKSGFSFNLGLAVPLPLSNPLYQDIIIRSRDAVDIATDDLEAARSRLEDELFFYPIQLHLSIGYNFGLRNR